jgi:uncharacterized membrane protein
MKRILMISPIALAAVVVWFVLTKAAPRALPNAADILGVRLASGKIDPDEYRERMEALREGDQSG